MRPGQYFISTHAFTEGDGIACINANRLKYFNSRLHGRRQFFSHIRHSASLFQLTPSRKATRSRATTMSKSEISTHAFTEGDLLSGGQYFFLFGFQLTPSRKATANSNNFCSYTHLIFINSFQISHSSFSFSPSFSSSCHFSGANLPVFFCLFTFRTRNMYTLS